MRTIPQIAIDFIAKQEACVLHVYDDAQPTKVLVPGYEPVGTLTAGWGHTGDGLTPGMDVTLAQAQAWLADDCEIAGQRLRGVVSDDVLGDLTDNQYSALISFVFNLGANSKWTIWKRLNARAFDQVPGEIQKFVNVGDQKIEGLVKRRAAEVALWCTDEPGSVKIAPPSSMTRSAAVTPPTPSDPVPMNKSKGLIAGVIGAASAAPPMIDQAIHAIEPYSRHSHASSVMLGILATLGSVCAGVTIFYVYRQKQNARN